MVKKNKSKMNGKKSKKIVDEDELSGGASLDDAFADDEDVEYALSKPKKEKRAKISKNVEEEIEEAEEEVEEIENAVNAGVEQGPVSIKASKPISKVKNGDRVRVDGKEYIVDQHYVLIDHGATKEMAIEVYDKDDKDFQIRYFDDQVDTTIEFYELQEIMFIKKRVQSIEW